MLSVNLNSCFINKAIEAPQAKSEFSVENGAIPPEFGSETESVLLCIKRNRNSYDKYLNKAIKRNYGGKYLVISQAQYESGNFNDKTKYRYVFDYSDGSSRTVTTNGMTSTAVYKRFYVEDRIKGKTYQSGAEFKDFGNAMNIYFKNLESKRLSYK